MPSTFPLLWLRGDYFGSPTNWQWKCQTMVNIRSPFILTAQLCMIEPQWRRLCLRSQQPFLFSCKGFNTWNLTRLPCALDSVTLFSDYVGHRDPWVTASACLCTVSVKILLFTAKLFSNSLIPAFYRAQYNRIKKRNHRHWQNSSIGLVDQRS